jgi:ATP-dependent RNA helicase RhlE
VNFASFGFPPPILKGIRASGLTEATAIQTKAIPIIQHGNDLIGIAESGAGKTGTYLFPILSRFLDRSVRLRGIILVPTRELASYVETRARDYARFTDLKIGVVYTGGPIQTQERLLNEGGINLLVATPGRLLELHGRGCLNVADVEILVFDEADRMVALGLAPDLRRLLKLLPETRQTLLFTLTLPPELNRLAKEALVEPVRVDVAPAGKPSAGITQAIYPVPRDLKPALFDELLSRTEVRSTVAVLRTRTAAEKMAKQLHRRGFSVALLDEHPSQNDRDRATEDLRRGRIQILVTSDAAARALDVAGTAHMVNYDVPNSPEEYVQRLGRAGRGDPVGDVFTLMSPEEKELVSAIEVFLGRAVPRVTLPDFDYEMDPDVFKQTLVYAEETAKSAERALRAAAAAAVHESGNGKAASAPSKPRRQPVRSMSRPAGGAARTSTTTATVKRGTASRRESSRASRSRPTARPHR